MVAALWQVFALKFIMLVFMGCVLVVERGVMRYDCIDPGIGHGNCCVVTPLSNGVQCRIDHEAMAQIVTGCAFDHAVAYLAY